MREYKTIDDAVKDYVAKRDRLKAWMKKQSEEEDRRKAELAKIEAWLLDRSNTLGVDSFKTTSGTAYKQLAEHFRISNWESFTEYIMRTGNFQLLEKRVAKLATKEVRDKTGELPDGIDVFSEYTIHVLRPTKKKVKE